MHRKPSVLLAPEQAIEGFILHKLAEGLSQNTIVNYRHSLIIFADRLGGSDLSTVSSADVAKHLAWLRTEYQPIRLSGNTSPLSNKTIRNHWVCLKSFFRWLALEFEIENPMGKVPGPKFKNAPVKPFTKEEVESLLKVSVFCKKADTLRRRSFTMRRPTAKRDMAAILMLIDTGLRAGEFCALSIGDVDLETGRVEVKHGLVGGAKGGQGRTVYLGRQTRHALWKYLTTREDKKFADRPLFLTKSHARMKPNGLRLVLNKLGEKAGVSHCHPHRLRHTFAITYLRSGGDVFTLQALLGHRSLEMVRHYSRIAEVDIAESHRRASPVDNWGL